MTPPPRFAASLALLPLWYQGRRFESHKCNHVLWPLFIFCTLADTRWNSSLSKLKSYEIIYFRQWLQVHLGYYTPFGFTSIKDALTGTVRFASGYIDTGWSTTWTLIENCEVIRGKRETCEKLKKCYEHIKLYWLSTLGTQHALLSFIFTFHLTIYLTNTIHRKLSRSYRYSDQVFASYTRHLHARVKGSMYCLDIRVWLAMKIHRYVMPATNLLSYSAGCDPLSEGRGSHQEHIFC